MIGKSTKQGHLLDGWMTTEGAAGRTGRLLEKLAGTIDFGPIEEELEKLSPTKMGRPSHPPLVLFKMLLLEHCYNLSDPEVEAQGSDRLSFRRFVGLSLDGAVPDETTLVEAATQRPTKEAYQSGQVTDPEASYTRKGGEAHYGFKAHVAVDGRHNLIRRVGAGHGQTT